MAREILIGGYRMSESMTLYKLIILYMLKKVSFPLTKTQITEFILEKGYTNYFTLQQAIFELIDSHLMVSESVHNVTHLRISTDGSKTLEFFESRISDAIKEDINQYLFDKKIELRNEVSILADYYKASGNEYTAHCEVKESSSKIIELTLSVTSEEEAETICNNWKSKSQEIYAYVMQHLLC